MAHCMICISVIAREIRWDNEKSKIDAEEGRPTDGLTSSSVAFCPENNRFPCVCTTQRAASVYFQSSSGIYCITEISELRFDECWNHYGSKVAYASVTSLIDSMIERVCVCMCGVDYSLRSQQILLSPPLAMVRQ